MTETQPNSKMRWIVVGTLVAVTAGAITAMAIIPPEGGGQQTDTTPPGLPPLTTQTPFFNAASTQPVISDQVRINELTAGLANSTVTPGQPWEYNPTTNKHFDPRPGHGHWHDGAAPTIGPDGNPTPWYYNPATNQHWDARPGHDHWHSGPVPVPLPTN